MRNYAPVGGIVRVNFPDEGIVCSNGFRITWVPYAGLYLINIILAGYKLWFGITRTMMRVE